MSSSAQTPPPADVEGHQLEQCGQHRWERALARFGRDCVLELRTASRRRVFAPTLSVHRLTAGPPLSTGSGPARVEAPVATWSPAQAAQLAGRWDWHLRRDLALRLLEQGAPEPGAGPAAPMLVAWTRSGPAEQQDGDAAWWAATCSAAADIRVSVPCLVVVTRWGWWTLPEGPEHYWERLRDRRVRSRRVRAGRVES